MKDIYGNVSIGNITLVKLRKKLNKSAFLGKKKLCKVHFPFWFYFLMKTVILWIGEIVLLLSSASLYFSVTNTIFSKVENIFKSCESSENI